MLVLRKTHASQLAQQHTPPSGLMTNGDSTGKSLKAKNKFITVQNSVVGDNTGRRHLMVKELCLSGVFTSPVIILIKFA
jgi:hypothetical protein